MGLKHLVFAAVVDVLLLLALGLYFLFNKLVGKPFVRGFFCDDLTISFPYKKDSISWILCLLIGGLVPLFIIIALELVLRMKRGAVTSVRRIVEAIFVYVAPFVAGFFFEHMFVEVAKFNIGRLRPNFIDNCRPYFTIEGSVYDCHNTTNPSRYVDSYDCVNPDYRESLLSFPSGHTSLITYAMVFAVGYLQMRMPSIKISFLTRPFIQLGLLMLAWYISLSRVSDYKHHWTDVLAGSLIGSITALVALHFVWKWRRESEEDDPSEESNLVND